MKLNNNYVVAKGHTIHVKGQPNFGQGKPFPAADLEIDEKSFESLVRDGTLVLPGKAAKEEKPPKEPEGDEKKDELEEKTKAELQEFAEDLDIQYPPRAGKDELIELIRKATA